MEIVWSQVADRDLARIYSYLEPRSLRAVRGLLRRLFRAIDMLAEMPRMGAVADLGTEREYRQHVVEDYKIYYYVEEKRLVIVRLWDTRQNPTTFFISDPP